MDHKGSECNTVSCYECGISCFHVCETRFAQSYCMVQY